MIRGIAITFFLSSALIACGSKGPIKEIEKEQTPKEEVKESSISEGQKQAEVSQKVVAEPSETKEVPKESVEEEDENSPKSVIQRYTLELQSLVDPDGKNKPRDADKEAKIAEKVRRFFDFPGLARMSLGHHWSKITAGQRKEFSRLFIDLIEDSYLRRSRAVMGEYEIEFGDQEIHGKRAKVVSTVARTDADIDITYELHQIGGNWMIFNIVLDNVDLIRNYQSQFNSIIAKSSINGLLDKMRKKKEEIKNGDKNNI